MANIIGAYKQKIVKDKETNLTYGMSQKTHTALLSKSRIFPLISI